jgi:hypothetical protein
MEINHARRFLQMEKEGYPRNAAGFFPLFISLGMMSPVAERAETGTERAYKVHTRIPGSIFGMNKSPTGGFRGLLSERW